MNEKQSAIVEQAEIISKEFYSTVRMLKGDAKELCTQRWLNELNLLGRLYSLEREKEGNDE